MDATRAEGVPSMEGLTVTAVAARLKVSTLTVRRWLRAGSLGGSELDDRVRCRISEADLASFLDARHRGGVHERPRRQPLAP